MDGDVELGSTRGGTGLRGGYAAFSDDEPALDLSFNTDAGSSPGDLTPTPHAGSLLGRREPLARMLMEWRDEDESGGGGIGPSGDALMGGGGGTDKPSLGASGAPFDALAEPSAFPRLLRAFFRGLAFPLAIGQQLGRVPFLASFGPWALALAIPIVFVASAPHGPASVSAVEGFGPLVLILASTHLAALGDDYAGTAMLQLQGLSAIAGLSLVLPGGRARPANELAADIRARASRWKSSRLFSTPFGVLCFVLGGVHAALPALQRSWLGLPLLGAEPDGRTTAACACVSIGGFIASTILFGTFVFFGR